METVNSCTEPTHAEQTQHRASPPHCEDEIQGDELGRVRRGSAAPRQPDHCLDPSQRAFGLAEGDRLRPALLEIDGQRDLSPEPRSMQQRRFEGHLFISVLAYHFVHTLRSQLKACGVNVGLGALRKRQDCQFVSKSPYGFSGG